MESRPWLCVIRIVGAALAATLMLHSAAIEKPAGKEAASLLTEACLNPDNERVSAATREGDYTQALALGQAAVKQLKDRGVADCRLAVALGNLGTSNFNLGNYVTAEQQMNTARRIWENQGLIGQPGLVRSLANLMALYVDCGEYGKAKAAADRIIVIPMGQQFSAVDRVLVLNNVARLHESMSNFGDAESVYAEAITTLEVGGLASSRVMAIVLNNRGSLMFKRHRYQEAGSDFTDALSILDARVESTHPAMVEPLVNMAHAEIHAKRYIPAAVLLARALQITTLHPVDSPRERQILSCYATVLRRLHRKDEARSADRRAKELPATADVNRRALASTVDFRF